MSEIKDNKDVNVTDKPSELKSKGSETSEVRETLNEKYKKFSDDDKSKFEYPKKELNVESGEDSKKKFEKKEKDNEAAWVEDFYNQRDKKNKVEEKNPDRLSHVSNFDDARRKAFDYAEMTDPNKVKFTKVDTKTGTVVEFKGSGGSKVAYDSPHEDMDHKSGHDMQHISWQAPGKRTSDGRQRGNITYEGDQHPYRSRNKGEGNLE